VAPLFTVETARLRLTWSGPRARPAGERLAVRAVGGSVRLDGGDPAAQAEKPLRLEEETTYPVLVQSLGGAPVALHHRDPVVVGRLVAADGGRVVHGRVRFGSQAGRARFRLLADGRPEAEVEVDVAPTKLSWADVQTMRDEVEAAAAGLALAALRPTVLNAAAGPAEASEAGWLAALGAAAGRLAEAAREIDRRPALDTVRASARVRAERVRRATPETRRALRTAGLPGLAGAAASAPVRLPSRPPTLTADTPAHRWIAARLDRALARLARLAEEERRRRPGARRAALAAEVEALAVRLRRVRQSPVLAASRPDRAPDAPPLLLRRRPAYAEAYAALRALDRGLDLWGGALDVATQDLAVLYETWAALAVVHAVADVLGVAPPDRPFGVEARGSDVRLRRGRRHAARLAGRDAEVEVVYNPRFPAPPALLVQRPDLWLTVRAPGRPVRRVVLDAKYRRDDSAAYRRRHGAPGPPEDALGTLHRYRDAIVGPDRQPGWVDTAAALFPGTADAAFSESRLWTSLDALGVGAVPLRPGHAGAFRQLVERWVG
jgi:hypothetical protein